MRVRNRDTRRISAPAVHAGLHRSNYYRLFLSIMLRVCDSGWVTKVDGGSRESRMCVLVAEASCLLAWRPRSWAVSVHGMDHTPCLRSTEIFFPLYAFAHHAARATRPSFREAMAICGSADDERLIKPLGCFFPSQSRACFCFSNHGTSGVQAEEARRIYRTRSVLRPRWDSCRCIAQSCTKASRYAPGSCNARA